VVGIDQIVGGIGEEGMPLVRARPLGCRIGSRDELRCHRRRCPKSRIIQSRKIFARGANRGVLDLLRLPVLARNRALLVGVGGDEAGIDRKFIGADQGLLDIVLQEAVGMSRRRAAFACAAGALIESGALKADAGSRALRLLRDQFEPVGHSAELGKRMGVHLPHCPAAVDLHGSFGDADIAGNLFAKATLRDVNHDFALSGA
jgi:hypothetical protein